MLTFKDAADAVFAIFVANEGWFEAGQLVSQPRHRIEENKWVPFPVQTDKVPPAHGKGVTDYVISYHPEINDPTSECWNTLSGMGRVCHEVILAGIAATELAHVIRRDDELPDEDSRRRTKKFVDPLAGKVLGYLGLDLEHHVRFILDLGSEEDPAHEHGDLRKPDIRAGYLEGCRLATRDRGARIEGRSWPKYKS